MERDFQRDIQQLEEVFRFIDEFAGSCPLGDKITFALRFAIEEIFTNMSIIPPALSGQ